MSTQKVKMTLFLLMLSFLQINVKAQCNPNDVDCLIGFHPNSSALPCVETNKTYNTVLYFCLETGLLGNPTIIRFDSITGLPEGIFYQFNELDRSYSEERGCISFSGITTDTAGRYPIRIYISFSNSFDTTTNYEIFDELANNQFPRPYFEVIESGSTCPNQLPSAVSTLQQNPISIIAYPNPAKQQITFTSSVYFHNVTVNIYDVLGKKVITTINNRGSNIELNIEALQKGFYFYEIKDKQISNYGKFYVE